MQYITKHYKRVINILVLLSNVYQLILSFMQGDFLSIKEAARFLCVSKVTLRNWDRDGKLTALRHPINNYRVYKREDLEKIVKQMESGERPVRRDKNAKRRLTVIHVDD